ncbi:Diadenosine tetraphosphatase [Lunatimonas lonarensis]|uniref:Diadenosine tetraphosphatase n=1 Tax=Lunatimonas lonarensis TaxID=1232681 RepID=R7ZUW1_9BACT|nr:metallophosphoesterase [Lunatimonas lonarensis]EON77818.1 Diadenosine tetraphosphatase [Lunatimonas lonarensis]
MVDKEKNLFIIGDVHGCWHTYSALLGHWEPDTELLIQVGDLVDRGRYSHKCLETSRNLELTHPDGVVFLKGNHELMMIKFLQGKDPRDHWIVNGGRETLLGFAEAVLDILSWRGWLEERGLVWENQHVLVSHAGVSFTENPFDEENRQGVLWNRGTLRDVGKIQVIGHTPQIGGKAAFTESPPSWNVDTGAFRGICLTGIKMDASGVVLEEINIPTDPRDIYEKRVDHLAYALFTK